MVGANEHESCWWVDLDWPEGDDAGTSFEPVKEVVGLGLRHRTLIQRRVRAGNPGERSATHPACRLVGDNRFDVVGGGRGGLLSKVSRSGHGFTPSFLRLRWFRTAFLWGFVRFIDMP